MKLSEFVTKPLMEALLELDLTNMKVHTDDAGNVCAVELKYEVAKSGGDSGEELRSPFD